MFKIFDLARLLLHNKMGRRKSRDNKIKMDKIYKCFANLSDKPRTIKFNRLTGVEKLLMRFKIFDVSS